MPFPPRNDPVGSKQIQTPCQSGFLRETEDLGSSVGQIDCCCGRFDNELAEPKQKKKPQSPAALFLTVRLSAYSLASCGLRDLARSSRFDGGSTDDGFRGFFFIPVLA